MRRWVCGVTVAVALLGAAPATGVAADAASAAAEYLAIVAPANRDAAALAPRTTEVDDAGDTYRILDDLIARRGLRQEVRRGLVRSDVLPGAAGPQVDALVAATSEEIARYDTAIEQIDTGELADDALEAIDDAERARGEAAADLRETLGLPTEFEGAATPADLAPYSAPTPLWSGGRQLIVLVVVYGLCGVLVTRMVRRSLATRAASRA